MESEKDTRMDQPEAQSKSGASRTRGDPPGEPVLSAIVVVPDTFDTVRRTLRHLELQTIAGQIEIVVVTPSADLIDLSDPQLAAFHSSKVVEIGEVTSIGCGFVAGIRNAHAPIVALTEDHSFPDPNWAKLFVAAHGKPWAAVGPCMRNANPETVVSRADFYQAYGEWTRPLTSGIVRHLPGHNSSYKRDILLALGSELDAVMEAESVAHRLLRARGYELWLEAGTCTSHLNFTTWSRWLPCRFYAGRQFASAWASGWFWPRRILFMAASPGIPLLRLWHIQRNIRRIESTAVFLRLLPALTAGLLVEAAGHALGYIAGAGDCNEKMQKYEFHRV